MNRNIGVKEHISQKVLSIESINQRVRNMEYAVRGPIPAKAEELKLKLLDPEGSNLPFKKTVFCNIGNPQELGQKPVTFLRQVSALSELPELLTKENRNLISNIFNSDVIERAEKIQKMAGGSVGAYSDDAGIFGIRKSVAEFIQKRDGFPSDPSKIQLTNGSTGSIERTLELIISNENVGIMIPIPQYPLYSASITRLGAKSVYYYLEESKGWGVDTSRLLENLKEARNRGIDVRAIVIINPGNPTGSILTLENMKDIISICEKEKLVILADEVYQTNVYMVDDFPFHSFKKVISEMKSNVELFSFHSISKGMFGECGKRGGYMEMYNIDQNVMDQLTKMATVSLCPNVPGQIALETMVNPPREGDESYQQFKAEIDEIHNSLKRRCIKLQKAFNEQVNITCNPAQGAMYLFPQIKLPQRFITETINKNKVPDVEYCIEMLETTGVCVVPGSGFEQEIGTYHFRCTFLPQEDEFDEFIKTFSEFNTKFMERWN
ncbi:hypothetical protein BB559_000057 [Furculomyces boomerangus]|uniref:Glutamate pyruvate transaminase n=2 Tax=Harpellales TaxID=61421 RepID=A0A2T9Z6L2_9FUNG|nr:hypothetical protein BB559_000057 [Furculomyces boomerangus]PVZ98954.1 hypothetical protein BB558_005032 [Smittium angustum]